MNWNTLDDFLAMGGYALYVWGAVLVFLLFLLGEVFALRLRRRDVVRRLLRARIAGERGSP